MINEPDNHLIYIALRAWANYVETRNPTLSAKELLPDERRKLRILDDDQMALVLRLRNLASQYE